MQLRIEEDLIRVVESLYNNANIVVLLGVELGKFFSASPGVRQGHILSPVLFIMFKELCITHHRAFLSSLFVSSNLNRCIFVHLHVELCLFNQMVVKINYFTIFD